MIAHLNGTVSSVAPDGAVIDVGGVGLLVQCTPGTLAGLRTGERTRVATSLVVREDALTLYGFAGEDERNTFELLQTASGVGPRLALAMLAVFTPDALRRAVAAEDLAALTTVPGIGRKGAQRIVLELAGRLGSPGDGLAVGPPSRRAGPGARAAAASWRDQVRAGLVSLGWQARDADQAIAAVEPELAAAGAAALRRCCCGRAGGGRAGRGRGGGAAGRAARAGAHVTGRGAEPEATRGRGGWARGSETGERVVSAIADADDRVIESALRPKRLSELVGQARVREQLSLLLEGAVRRGRPPDHVLISGPPGLGKTTIAMIIAAELGAPLRITSGPAIERAGDLAAMLSTLGEGEVVFIDEIHRVARPAEEMLYLAMEDFRVDVVIGKGPGATAIPLEIAPFTLVAATTRAGLLPAPLRDRFGFTAHLDFYEAGELGVIVRRSAGLLGVALRDDGADEIAGRSRGTPRIANRLLRRVRDYAEVRADGVVTKDVARAALELYEVDDFGLDRLDRAVLTAVVRRFGGGPVGLSTLAVAVGEEAETVEVVVEPFLVRLGLLARTPRGRVATPAAWERLGLAAPAAPAEPRGPRPCSDSLESRSRLASPPGAET